MMTTSLENEETSDILADVAALAEEAGASRIHALRSALRAHAVLGVVGRKVVTEVVEEEGEDAVSFMRNVLERAAIMAQEQIIDSRYANSPVTTTSNEFLETEEQIADEAVRMCRP